LVTAIRTRPPCTQADNDVHGRRVPSQGKLELLIIQQGGGTIIKNND